MELQATLKDNIWDKEIIDFLQKIRTNSIMLSDKHKRKFYKYKNISNYFDLPVLVLSAFSSPLSVGSQNYLQQETVSLITCAVGLVIAIITSIKLYLNITDTLERENKVSRDFYVLSIDIYKMLTLPQHRRLEDPLTFLNKNYNAYVKLLEQSTLLKRRFKQDQLIVDLPDIVYFTDESEKGSGFSSRSSSPKVSRKDSFSMPITRHTLPIDFEAMFNRPHEFKDKNDKRQIETSELKEDNENNV